MNRKHPLYLTWKNMRARCNCPTNVDYKLYGAVGITVCERWSVFTNFVQDMGPRPNGMTLDRIDGSKGYSPENCRWATAKDQNRNQKTNRVVTIDGVSRCVGEWSEISGVERHTIYARLERGIDAKAAVFTPAMKTRPRKILTVPSQLQALGS